MSLTNASLRGCRVVLAASALVVLVVCDSAIGRQESSPERLAAYSAMFKIPSLVRGGTINPGWLPDGESFWFAEGSPADTTLYVVRPGAPEPAPLLDRQRVREKLEQWLGHAPPYAGLPFDEIEFTEDGGSIEFSLEDRPFRLDLESYALTALPVRSEQDRRRTEPQLVEKVHTTGAPDVMEVPSPDGRWFVTRREQDIYLRSALDDRLVHLTENGEERDRWSVSGASWSSDSNRLLLMRVDSSRQPRLPVVHWLKKNEQVDFVPFTRTGEAMARTELYFVDRLSKRQVLVKGSGEVDHYYLPFAWLDDDSAFLFLRMSRTYQQLDLLAADPDTGESRLILSDTSETFIGALQFTQIWRELYTTVGDGSRFVWMSERDGWRHLYLYDVRGSLIRKLTAGSYPVIDVVHIDAGQGWVYFTANAEPEPYDQHLYRVDLKGQTFEKLTSGRGRHSIHFAPSGGYFVDTHSSVVRPPVTEYRRANGSLLSTVSEANISGLEQLHWSSPEEFVVRAADGATDLHGVLYKPPDFDPGRKYPLVDYIYNGPFTTWVPRTFLDGRGTYAQALAQLGFLVLFVDGRGTIERGKQFQDVVYKNFGTHEISDHAAVLEALAESRPYIDLERVGIFGGSWGGYMTTRAMLTFPEVYKVGVAAAPVYDLYDHAASAIEGYMGLPQEHPEAYERASSIRLVDRLKGKLLLIHGTGDVNATFSASMKMTSALIRAGKQHDLVVLPGSTHGPEGAEAAYLFEARRRYLVRHLDPERELSVDSGPGG